MRTPFSVTEAQRDPDFSATVNGGSSIGVSLMPYWLPGKTNVRKQIFKKQNKKPESHKTAPEIPPQNSLGGIPHPGNQSRNLKVP